MAFLILTGLESFAQTEADTSAILQKIYTLGEVTVSSPVDRTTIDAAVMQKYSAKAGSRVSPGYFNLQKNP
jgi:hypothetical protein